MNQDLVFQSDRSFTLFSFNASHGLLLLRSRKTKQTPTRIDILVQDVRALEIRSWFDGVTIVKADQTYLIGFRSNPVDMIEPGNTVYSLIGVGWQGFVVGGILAVREDDGEYTASSGLI